MLESRAILQKVQSQMLGLADGDRAAEAGRFFPGKPVILGLPSGYANELGRELAVELKGADIGLITDVAEGLYSNGVMEHGAVANEMLGRMWQRFDGDYWGLFDRWVGLFTCWGTTDSFCLKVLSHLVLRDGLDWPLVRAWSQRRGLWYRRAALVCLARGLRKGLLAEELFQLADQLLEDKEPMVQKAIGWMLKELSKGDAGATIGYLNEHGDHMTRLAFRYAQEKLTTEQKARVVSF